jgi:protein gp37
MKNSNIQWTTHTFNPWEGCTKVSPGCLNCYAENRNIRFAGGANWGKGAPRRRTSAANWNQPVKWNREAGEKAQLFGNIAWAKQVLDQAGETQRPRVFCASLADWLDEEVSIEWFADLLELVRSTPQLDWLLLTKRPESWESRLLLADEYQSGREHYEAIAFIRRWIRGTPPANVWIGTTGEDQKRLDERVAAVLKIPARIRFLSIEPQLELVNPEAAVYGACRLAESEGWGIHWVICGGESGPGARPFFVEWADDLRRRCKSFGVAFFMKQFGSNPRTENANAHDWPEHVAFEDDGKSGAGAAAARILFNDRGHGGDIEEFPEELRVREFPVVV